METSIQKTAPITDRLLDKTPTGIGGVDEILFGGIPTGRITLVCGGPGCGKTLFSTEFLVRGALQYNEPGLLVMFEETESEIVKNVSSLGIDLSDLVAQKKIFVDSVHIERSEIEETGEYDLEGLFIRLASGIEAVGAKRVVLDTIEVLFSGFSNEALLRAEIRRLFRWLKKRGVTTIVTGEQGDKTLTRYGLEEYVSDCVILLENRIENKISNRLLRVVKYRGSSHSTDENPFLIDQSGLWAQPPSSTGLNYQVSTERISTGIPGLDEMMGGKGYYRGSSILISGTAGTGKTSLAAALVDCSCRRGERSMYFSFEESGHQVMRNMLSIGMDLKHWVDRGLLRFHSVRPSLYGIEMHLLSIEKQILDYRPALVVFDPMTNFNSIGSDSEVKSMLTRLIDFLKVRQITACFTSLIGGSDPETTSEVGISSLMDTWLFVRNLEHQGERNRALYVLKARGLAHSSQVREFQMADDGIHLIDVVIGPEGVLTGSFRTAQEALEKLNAEQRRQEIDRQKQALERKRRNLENQIAALKAEFAADEEVFLSSLQEEESRRTGQKAFQDHQSRERQGNEIND